MPFPATASAQPPGFPDLDQFTAVDPAPYEAQRHWGTTLYFSAPGGLRCYLAGYAGMNCLGITFDIPGVRSRESNQGCTWVGPEQIPASGDSPHPYQFRHRDRSCPTDNPDTPLTTGSKISYIVDQSTIFTCAAASNETVACIDRHNHGFVVQPTGSWTF